MNVIKWLDKNVFASIPYYHIHGLIAVTIMAVTSVFMGIEFGYAAGIFFYLGREIRDAEKDKEYKFSWKDFIYPVIYTTILYVILKLYKTQKFKSIFY